MSKILSLADLWHAARDWRREGATVVLAAGCFDPIHPGHIQHLEAARKLGNVLVVGVASDRVVREYKGTTNRPRPFMPDTMRAGIVAGLRAVDAVVINDQCCELIRACWPHIYVKGEEYRGNLTPDLKAESELLTTYGGRLEFVSGEEVHSSTALLAASV